MLEGELVNLRVMEEEDLPLFTERANNPEFGGEYEPLEQISCKEVEKWYNSLGSREKWLIIEKKDGRLAKYSTRIVHIGCEYEA